MVQQDMLFQDHINSVEKEKFIFTFLKELKQSEERADKERWINAEDLEREMEIN